uniref:Pro-corazonin n=1 Tax=Cacopsylla melanoneura TaxID=428564 RepID=A0A8D8Q1T4_9HEMI
MFKTFFMISCVVCVLLANCGIMGQITFSRDWRPNGKRSVGPLSMNNAEYNTNLKSALAYTKLAEIHLQYLLTSSGHADRNLLFKSYDSIIPPFFVPIASPEEDKFH